MQRLAEICIARPVFATTMILALVIAGAASYFDLGVDRLPGVDLPTVVVRTDLAGASSVEIETQVTEPLEEAINSVAGIDQLASISAPGRSYIRVFFDLDRNIDVAAQDIRDALATVVRDLPPQAETPIVQKLDNEQSPVLEVALYGDRSIRELTEIAETMVKRRLERVSGVGEAQVVGGLERSMNIWVDADRLTAYGLPITAVRDAIVRQHFDSPGGNLITPQREQTLRTLGRLSTATEFNKLAVGTRGGTPIRVHDIGEAEDGTKERRSIARLNGTPAVTIEVRRQSGANTVAVIDGIKAELAIVADQLPGGIQLEIVRDQSRYIHLALHEIKTHLIAGAILACLVVLIFLRSARSMLIAGVAIPASIIATFVMMWIMDFTLNSVTMLALVLMVGIVIDDSLIVLENIFRFIEEKSMPPFEAARAATAEIGMTVAVTSFALVAIFVPVSFMSSVSGRFLFQFGLTASVAVLVSLLVSFTLAPMMSARLLRASRNQPERATNAPASRSGFYRIIDGVYAALLRFSLKQRWLATLIALGIMAGSFWLYPLVQQEYTPGNVDEGEFEVVVRTPEGVSIYAMDRVMATMEEAIIGTPGVMSVLASVGPHLSSSGSLNQTRAYVRLEPHEQRRVSLTRIIRETLRGRPGDAFRGNYTQREVMQEVRSRLRGHPGLRVSVRNTRWFNLGGAGEPIDFVLRGPDLEALADYMDSLVARANELGIMDAGTTLQIDRPEVQARIDRDRASALDVAIADIASTIRLMVGGDDRVARFRDPLTSEEYDIQVRLRERDRAEESQVAELFVPSRTGELVRIDNVVDFDRAITASRIDRLDRQRQVSLRATPAPGYAQADRIEALREAVQEMNLPPTYTTTISGSGRELERTIGEFLIAFGFSIVFVYLLLAAKYEKVLDPLAILLVVPLTVPFALLVLWLAGQTLNLYSALGLLVLFGVAMKHAIMQVDHTNGLRDSGMDRHEAIMRANRDRLRPILMTTVTLIAGMAPLLIGAGPGAEERRAVAVVVIGGLSTALFLTLIMVPVAYSLLDDLRRGLRRLWLWMMAGDTAPDGAARGLVE